MKKTYFVDTNDASVELVLSFLAEQKGYVRVRGYDTNDKETVYFDRRDAINKGKASISIPLPLSPKKLCVEVITQRHRALFLRRHGERCGFRRC